MMQTQTSAYLIAVACAFKALTSICFVSCETTDPCGDLRAHITMLETKETEALKQFAPDRECPIKYKFRLDAAEKTEPSEDVLMKIDEVIGELRILVDPPIPDVCTLCVPRKRTQAKAALTYAHFYRTGRLFIDGQVVLALIEVERVKILRRTMEGVYKKRVFDFAHHILSEIASLCEGDPTDILGLRSKISAEQIHSAYNMLKQATNDAENGREEQEEKSTMKIIQDVISYAHEQALKIYTKNDF